MVSLIVEHPIYCMVIDTNKHGQNIICAEFITYKSLSVV